MRRHLLAFTARKPVKAPLEAVAQSTANGVAAGHVAAPQAVVLPYKPAVKRATAAKTTLKVVRQRPVVAAAR